MYRLLIGGMVLFVLGLLTGVAVPAFTNPRMGLAAHLAGVQNALVLLAFGLLWQYLELTPGIRKLCLALSLYSLYAIWVAQVFAAVLGTSSATPIAGAGFAGSVSAEAFVNLFLYSGASLLIVASAMVLHGLIKHARSALEAAP